VAYRGLSRTFGHNSTTWIVACRVIPNTEWKAAGVIQNAHHMRSYSVTARLANEQSDRRTELSIFPSAAFRRVLSQLDRFARDRTAAILLEGESGTGKTLLARYIHARSPRAARPFQHVVLSTLDDALAGSELFGHVTGAYTDARQSRSGQFVSANGGTLFLDEIGKTSLAVQQKLLHVVEYNEFRPVGSDREVRVDVRLIAATNQSLLEAMEDQRFLPDLHARLSAFRVRIPALRERRADIPVLVEESVNAHALACGYGVAPTVHPELMTALQHASWPNNLRQLDAAIHRILIDAEGAAELTLTHCEDDDLGLPCYSETVQVLTPERIADAIARTGTVSGAARLLKVDRTTIHRHQRRLGLGASSRSAEAPDQHLAN
jgi:DNA-binding NtrC family response regulator